MEVCFLSLMIERWRAVGKLSMPHMCRDDNARVCICQ